MKKQLLLVLSILIITIMAFNFKNFRIDASSDTLVAQNDKDFEYFSYYNKILPSSKFLILAIKSKKEIDNDYLEELKNLNDKFKNIKEIDNIFSIINAPILFLNNTTLADLSNNKIENIFNTKYQLSSVLDEFSNNPFFKDQIINKNKNISSMILYLKNNNELNKKYENKSEYLKIKNDLDEKRNKLIQDIRKIINDSNPNYQYFLGGIDMIADDVISFVKKDILLFSISVFILIFIILLIIFRTIKWVLICLLTSIYAVAFMFGLLGILNLEVTAVSSNFVSLMFILSISMNIHIINNYKQNFVKESKNLYLTTRRMFWPCFYTVLTTIVAFTSLIISDIKPIIDFGFIMILSLTVIILTSFTILPLLISFFPNPKNSKSINFNILDKFFNFSIEHFNKIILFNLILFFISIYGIFNLNVENSFINYFKKDTAIYKGMKIIDTELGGTTPIDVILTFNEDISTTNNDITNLEEDILVEDDFFSEDIYSENELNQIWFNEEKLNIIKNIHKYLENRNEIGKVQSIDTLIEIGNKINKYPLSIFELSVLYNEIPINYKKSLIDPFLSIENNMVKISARTKDSLNIDRNKLINEINFYIKKNYENLKEIKVNGLLVLYNNMLQSLFSSQIKSLGFVILAIFIMFLILFKSFKLSIIGIIPNILASSFILGVIGILKIPLDIMTITVAAITIGIAVDNTIHYLYRYKENLKTNEDQLKAINFTHNNVGYAVLTTSLTIAIGFSVLSLSNFIPTVLFGLFTGLAMIAAMLGVLLTLSSLLYKFKT